MHSFRLTSSGIEEGVVYERHVSGVAKIFELLEVIVFKKPAIDSSDAIFFLVNFESRKLRRSPFAQIDENEAQIFQGWV